MRPFVEGAGKLMACWARGLSLGAAIATAVVLCAAAAQAAVPVEVKDAWVRAPAPGQKVAGAYMELVSRGNLVLISVASPAADRVELHNTTMEEGVMKMRPVNRVELSSGKAVKLEPGGLHLMLIDVKQPLKPGAKVPLALTVQRADFSRVVFTVHAEVRAVAAGKTHDHR